MEKKFVILTKSEIDGFDLSGVLETNKDMLRWNNDKTKTFVKFIGETPEYLKNKNILTLSEMLNILENPLGGWYVNE